MRNWRVNIGNIFYLDYKILLKKSSKINKPKSVLTALQLNK